MYKTIYNSYTINLNNSKNVKYLYYIILLIDYPIVKTLHLYYYIIITEK